MDTDISEINEIDNFRNTTEKKQAGRPTKYSEKIFNVISHMQKKRAIADPF